MVAKGRGCEEVARNDFVTGGNESFRAAMSKISEARTEFSTGNLLKKVKIRKIIY